MNPMGTKLHLARRALAMALLAIMATPALPQAGNRYTVEIVVFRNGGTGAALAPDAVLPAGGDDIEPTASTARRLGGAATRLRGTSGFKVLAHTAWSQAPAAYSTRRGVSAARLGLTSAGIQGKVMLLRGDNLNLGLDLVIQDGDRRYYINQVRRIGKTDEVHYFDHPAFGVLAVVSAGG